MAQTYHGLGEMEMKQLWILVEVRSGIPASVQVFENEELAQSREQELRNSVNLENDETGIFAVNLENVGFLK